MKPDYTSIVILTGAGISAESGIDTFRDKGGLWEQHNIEDVATPEGFARNPVLVHEFYNARRQAVQSVAANEAHFALGRLLSAFAGDVMLVTQNVDNLHEKGGAEPVIHMHGELGKIRCGACERVQEFWGELTLDNACGFCGIEGMMRPHVVWFGEMPLYMNEIGQALRACDLFISIGTSGNVYPAAGFVAEAAHAGAHTVELNLEPSEGARLFDEAHYGPATKVVPAFVDYLLEGTAIPKFTPA